jgi:hypothetical protein
MSRVFQVHQLVKTLYAGWEFDKFDYYIYNNSYFVPVQVDLDDEVSEHERLLHICTKGADPRDDRFLRPFAVHRISKLISEIAG